MCIPIGIKEISVFNENRGYYDIGITPKLCWKRDSICRSIQSLEMTTSKNRMELSMTKYMYYCNACHYCFGADALPDRCPDCGKQIHNSSPAVRPATDQEIADYIRIQKEIKNDEKN